MAGRFGCLARRGSVTISLSLLFSFFLLLTATGFGMILLNTLTRFHIAFTLLAAQVIGSVGTILARATAPNKVGPGDVFPDFSAGILTSLSKADFWVCLLFMLSINVFCFMFFRKEQLQKP
jgi:alpha-1,3-glucan synthase